MLNSIMMLLNFSSCLVAWFYVQGAGLLLDFILRCLPFAPVFLPAKYKKNIVSGGAVNLRSISADIMP